MNRNLKDVINAMLIEIPEESELRNCLNSKLESVRFSAPELMGMWWEEVHNDLIYHISKNPKEEWQYKVLSIFSTKTVDELKKIFKAIEKEGE